MPAGRPLLFKTVEELDSKIAGYFEITTMDEWTMSGLAVHLDTSRQTLCNYRDKPEYFDSIKKALSKVEMSYEIDLKKKGNTWTIFALKNMEWTDKQEIEQRNTNLDIPIEMFPEISDEKLKELINKHD